MAKPLFQEDDDQGGCSTPCYKPVPDIWERVKRNCCNVSRRKCPPKARARDAIRIDRLESKRCFTFYHNNCSGVQMSVLNNQYYRMDIREQGYCDILMCIPPESMTIDGSVCFVWPEDFLALPPGYYEADFYIDGIYRDTLLLVLPNYIKEGATSAVEYKQTCGECDKPKNMCGCGCDAIPYMDEKVAPTVIENCKSECSEC